MTKKIVAVLICVLMLASVFAGCTKEAATTAPTTDASGSAGTTTTTTGGGTDSAAGTAVDNVNAEQVVKLLYSDEIAEWNPLKPSSASTWANWIDTLVEYDNYGLCQPCLAESWTKSEDGLTWTFKIREGVKWLYNDGSEYGQDVTADDWVCTIEYILNPFNACRTADLIFVVAGAEDYYNAKEKFEAYTADPTGYMAEATAADPAAVAPTDPDFASVGVKAKSTYELEFTLDAPLPYFLSMLTYNWGYPTNRAYLTEMGEKFGTDNTTLLYCGAFLVSDWVGEAYYIEDENPIYWDKDKMYVTRIENTYNAEAGTLAPELLLRGEVTYADIPVEQIDEWMADPEKAALIRPNRPGTYSYFWLINFMPTYEEKEGLSHDQWLKAANNVNFRKSLYYGLDRIAAISVYDPYTPENYLLRSITPTNFCAAGGKDFTELGDLAAITSVDQFQSDNALAYKEKAIEELTAAGVTFPIIAYMPYNSGSSNQTNLAIVVSQQLEALLGTDYIKFVLEGYPDTDYLATTRRAGNYSFMMSYWGPDYADPETWTDPFALGQAYNYIWYADGMATKTTAADPDGRMGRKQYDENYWKDSKYDQMVDAATEEVVDQTKRYTDLANVEAWLIDQAFVIPLGTLGGTGYLSSYMNPFESQYAPFGASDSRYKYQVVMAKPMSTEEYLAGLEIWTKEREERIAAAQAAGLDY